MKEQKEQVLNTIEFVKSVPFPGKRYQVGDKLTGRIVRAFVRQDGVECFIFVSTEGLALYGVSYRSVTIS